jgi:predicted alpha/beta-fold hydrolase
MADALRWAAARAPPARAGGALLDTAADARVLAHCHWHPAPTAHPTIVLLHGLEGSSTVHYMRGMADKAWAEGFNVVRLNQRNLRRHRGAVAWPVPLRADARSASS